jgi:hypothetical protein
MDQVAVARINLLRASGRPAGPSSRGFHMKRSFIPVLVGRASNSAFMSRIRASPPCDFDWPGIQIANVIYRRHRFIPWRFSAADYSSASASLPLTGPPIEALWDSDLTRVMMESGHAIHEEQLLETLLLDLS